MTDYITLTEVKAYLSISGSGDDALLTALIGRASRLIEDHTGRWFYADTQTRHYDAVGPHIVSRLLLLDADLLTITALTNGDGAVISADDCILRPQNDPPYFGIALKASSNVRWTYADDPEGAISVAGTWGYSAAIPAAVAQAALRLTAHLYRQRDTGADWPRAGGGITERGAAVAPPDLPWDITRLLLPYIRYHVKAA
jgi:uncharacterized phiE125 gp8 family phage protein